MLILSLHKETGRPVVVLVDEYDKPIIDHIGRGGGRGEDIAKFHLLIQIQRIIKARCCSRANSHKKIEHSCMPYQIRAVLRLSLTANDHIPSRIFS